MSIESSTGKRKSTVVRVSARNQITIPQSIREDAAVSEGVVLTMTLTTSRTTVEPGTIIISAKPNKVWTKADWEREEAEADAEIEAGKFEGPYRGAKGVIVALRRKPKITVNQ